MKKALICVLLVLLLLGTAFSTASAVSYVTAENFKQAMQMSQIVVLGTVVEKRSSPGAYPDGSGPVELLLKVESVFAGSCPQYVVVHCPKTYWEDMLVSDAATGAASVAVGEKWIYFLTRPSGVQPAYTMKAEPFADHSFAFKVDDKRIAGAEEYGVKTLEQFIKTVKKYKGYLGADFKKRASESMPKPVAAKALIAGSDVVALVKLDGVSIVNDGFYTKAALIPVKVYKDSGFAWSERVCLPYGVENGEEYMISLTGKNGMYIPSEYYGSLARFGGKECKAIEKELAKGFEFKPYGKVLYVEAGGQKNFVDLEMDVDSLKITLSNKEEIYEYRYKSAAAAKKDAKGLSPSGSTYTVYGEENAVVTIESDYIKPPHFFMKDEKIVFYVGSNKTVIKNLTKLYGAQFAGK